MIKFFQWIYTLYSAFLFIILMLMFSLFIITPLLISDRGGKVSFIFIRLWARIWAALSGIRFEVYGKKHIDPTTSYIYVFNHRSYIDAPMIPLSIPQEVRAIGKKELSRIPLFGTLIGKVAVWVDRSSAASRKLSVARLIEYLDKGISIVMAPEGTRNDTADALLPFQRGAFRLSIESQIPIMPMAVIGADRIMKRGSILLSPGTVCVYFSPAMMPPANSETAVQEFCEKVRVRVIAMI
jgi:1-acyl-sn-glycerol-3-phosphate acyltransferase